MTVPARVSLITLGVADVAAATAFYQALGWQLSSASVPGEVSFFKTAGAIFAVWGAEELKADIGAPAETPSASGFRGVAIAINCADRAEVDAVLETVRLAGGRITKPASPTDWGGYSGYFADPDGHLFEVAHNPFWPLDDAGLPQLP
jgi:catechol 2,3-dioxygenase-like lactoylglutathione lyase family enzyme